MNNMNTVNNWLVVMIICLHYEQYEHCEQLARCDDNLFTL